MDADVIASHLGSLELNNATHISNLPLHVLARIVSHSLLSCKDKANAALVHSEFNSVVSFESLHIRYLFDWQKGQLPTDRIRQALSCALRRFPPCTNLDGTIISKASASTSEREGVPVASLIELARESPELVEHLVTVHICTFNSMYARDIRSLVSLLPSLRVLVYDNSVPLYGEADEVVFADTRLQINSVQCHKLVEVDLCNALGARHLNRLDLTLHVCPVVAANLERARDAGLRVFQLSLSTPFVSDTESYMRCLHALVAMLQPECALSFINAQTSNVFENIMVPHLVCHLHTCGKRLVSLEVNWGDALERISHSVPALTHLSLVGTTISGAFRNIMAQGTVTSVNLCECDVANIPDLFDNALVLRELKFTSGGKNSQVTDQVSAQLLMDRPQAFPALQRVWIHKPSAIFRKAAAYRNIKIVS